MNSLKGKTIFIGKEPEQGRLSVAVCGKVATIGLPGCVPGSVSRCIPQQNVAHAKIEVDKNGGMTLTNLKPANVTYVNGVEIMSKHITASSQVSLGKDRYVIDLTAILAAAEKLAPMEYDISPLEAVWNTYRAELKKLRDKQNRINLIRAASGILTSCAILASIQIGRSGYILTAIGVLGNIYCFFGMKNDNAADKQERLTEDFQEHYVCPKCNKFLGNYPYKLMKKQYGMQCPYCKCKFVEAKTS